MLLEPSFASLGELTSKRDGVCLVSIQWSAEAPRILAIGGNPGIRIECPETDHRVYTVVLGDVSPSGEAGQRLKHSRRGWGYISACTLADACRRLGAATHCKRRPYSCSSGLKGWCVWLLGFELFSEHTEIRPNHLSSVIKLVTILSLTSTSSILRIRPLGPGIRRCIVG